MTERLILAHRWFPPRQGAVAAHAALASWQRTVAARFVAAGGETLGCVGGTVIAAFDPIDLIDVIEVALDLLDEAEAAGELEIALGAALGPITESEGATVGEAIERAQLLASRARAGELVVDAGTRASAGSELLFGRRVAAGGARGTSVDRTHPRRAACAKAIAALAASPLPPIVDSVRRQIEDALARGEARTFILRGPVGAGATELVTALERSLSPGRVIRIGASPGGVVPLASLRLALARRVGSAEQVTEAYGPIAGPPLARVARGELIARAELAGALVELVRSSGERPWVVLSPLGLVDGATLAALLEARARGADFVLFGRFPVESPLPRPLVELSEPVVEHTLPPLKMADARVVAEAILGPRTASDVARRVAVLGGDTVLGVVEAARTLIANGDLVHEDGAFVWRLEPRHGAHAIGTNELLSERLELLDESSRRVLEALCVVPDGWPSERLGEVSALDGVQGHAFTRAVAALVREALATGSEHPRPASSLLRWRVLNLIPPARLTELHRFVSQVLRAREPSQAPLRAELGYYLLEGGLEDDARPHLTAAVEALVAFGYERGARQLSTWLGQRDESGAHDSTLGARPTPVPARVEFSDEPPPSSEYFLDELLEDATEQQAAQLRIARVPPPRPPTPAAAIPRPSSIESAPVKAPSSPAPDTSARQPERAATGADPRELDASARRPASGSSPPVLAAHDAGARPDAPAAAPNSHAPPIADARQPNRPAAASESFAPPIAAAHDAGARRPDAPSSPASSSAAPDIDTSARDPDTLDIALPPSVMDALPTPPPISLDAELDALLAAPSDTSIGTEPAPDEDEGEPFASEKTSVSAFPVRPFVHDAVRALRERDFAALEDALRRAVAQGSDLGAVGRVRAVAELARGDLEAARRRLREARARGRDDPADEARYHLASALLELRDGDPLTGIRAGLAALASSRRRDDARGELAAVHVLAACYRALGREAQAVRLELRSP